MKCPRCGSDLHIGERSGIEIDYCVSCRGIWLDSGELDKILERSQVHKRDSGDHHHNERESWWERILDFID